MINVDWTRWVGSDSSDDDSKVRANIDRKYEQIIGSKSKLKDKGYDDMPEKEEDIE